MKDEGWFKMYRQLKKNPVVMKDGDHLAVWAFILLSAVYEQKDVDFDGKRVTLKPGQFTTGRKEIAALLKINESKIERILKRFENDQQIEQQTNNKCRLITVKNWHVYQKNEQRNEQPANTNKEYKNTERIKNTKGRGETSLALVTPKEQAIDFFQDAEKQIATVQYLVEKGVSEEAAKYELSEFIGYWTELNPMGTKQRWQMQDTFEIRRRLVTWMKKAARFNRNKQAVEAKGIRL